MVLDAEQIEGWATGLVGDYSTTFSGKRYYPDDPRPEEVNLEDIAHQLSMVNRFSGATIYPYSVAQHSLLCERLACWFAPHLRLWALLHDAPEYVMGDMVSPLKRATPSYEEKERRLMAVIAVVYQLPSLSPEDCDMLKRLDRMAYAIERKNLTPNCEHGLHEYVRGFDHYVAEMDWRRVRGDFFNTVVQLMLERSAHRPLDRSPHVPV